MNAAAIFLLCLCASVTAFTTEVYTPNKYDYFPLYTLGVDISPGQTSFKFQVRASNDAHVAIHRFAGNTNQDMYEIVIGGWGNTQSVIRNKKQGTNLAVKKHTPLSRTAYRSFWVSWNNGRVAVGTGRVVGQNQFMFYTTSKTNALNYASVSTGWGATGNWRFESDSPLVVTTKNDYRYQPVNALSCQLQTKHTIIFYVKASNDAHIALQSKREDEKNGMYEIVIGGWKNSRSVIRESKQGANLASASHRPLSASTYTPFWITVSGGLVSVGEGTAVGSRRFMSYRGQTTDIKYFSVATGWGANGSWLFYPL